MFDDVIECTSMCLSLVKTELRCAIAFKNERAAVLVYNHIYSREVIANQIACSNSLTHHIERPLTPTYILVGDVVYAPSQCFSIFGQLLSYGHDTSLSYMNAIFLHLRNKGLDVGVLELVEGLNELAGSIHKRHIFASLMLVRTYD